MSSKTIFVTVAAAALLGSGFIFRGFERTNHRVEAVDFGKVKTAITPAYNAAVKPESDAHIKEFRIPIQDATIEIAPGVKYQGWTFGGTVPGPVLRVRQGDLVRITLVNQAPIAHSIDLHAARIPMNVAFKSINPGQELTFQFTANDPGVFMVHCGTPPVLMHIMQGMYMAIIVDPKDGWGTKADKEFVVVQSEFYALPNAGPDGTHAMDYNAAMNKQSSYVVFNGKANQYKDHPLHADVGDRVRFFVVNAGPNSDSDFHIVGTIFDRVYPDGDPTHALEHVQTQLIPAGGGAVFETVFNKDSNGEGVYAFVTHSFADASKGAVGLIQVGNAQMAGVTH